MSWLQRLWGNFRIKLVTAHGPSADLWADNQPSNTFFPSVSLAPTIVPGIHQEQFANGEREQARSEAEDHRVHYLHRRVVDTANSYVTRDYGQGPVLLADTTPKVPRLTAVEIEHLKDPHAGGFRFAEPEAAAANS